jgi:hypothetical protein
MSKTWHLETRLQFNELESFINKNHVNPGEYTILPTDVYYIVTLLWYGQEQS